MGLLDALFPQQQQQAQPTQDDNQPMFSGGLLNALNVGSPQMRDSIALGLSNLAHFDSGGIDMPAARAQLGQYQKQQTQRNQTRDWIAKNRPELMPMLNAGASPADVVMTALTPKLMTVSPGTEVVDTTTGKTVYGNNNNGAFLGQDLKTQAYNTILKGQSDPAARTTPEYRAAWAIVNQPVATPNGIMVAPNLPQQWAPDAAPTGAPPPDGSQDAGMVAPVAGPASPQMPQMGTPATPTSATLGDMQMIAPPQKVQPGPGVIPGTKPYNESQARLSYLTQSATPDLKRVVDGFPALMNTKDQLLAKDPTGITRGLQDPAYQQTSNAVRAAMGNILYFVSGAAQGNVEVERKLDSYVPKFGEGPQVAADDLERFANDVVSMANASGDPNTIAWAQQAVSGVKDTQAKILGTQRPPATGAPNVQSLLDKYK